MKQVILSLFLAAFFVQVGAQEEKPAPCSSEKYRQFDFWVGDWNTYGPKGALVGTNNIVKMHGDCVIQENWISKGLKYTGTSYNFYDAQEGKWMQTWVDNQGGSLQLSGGLDQNGSMVLQSEAVPQPEGGSSLNKITWTPNKDGSVRQHWETSRDYGATWTTLFDGLYKKKENEK